MSASETLEKYRDLLDSKALAHLATLMPDGSPQVTPVWFMYDGTFILINTARGRIKDRNMEHDRRVAVEIMDPANTGRYVQIRGKVVEISEEEAAVQVHQVARKYTGQDYQWGAPDQVRVLFKILPEKVNGN